MIKKFISRYSPRYPRALVYMLQSSEYSIVEYFAWYHRTTDFSRVEKRQRLDMTAKARLLLATLWGAHLAMAGFLVTLVLVSDSLAVSLTTAVFILLAWPYLLAYGLALPLWLGQVLIQHPRERAMTRRARQKLAASPATKIAIAGSFGKTTFKESLATVLRQGKIVAATPGNMNTPIGISRFVDQLQGDEEILIFELGEYYPGDIAALCSLVQPDIGIITGVNEAHLSKFKTLERAAATIFELADYLQNKPLYVNGESQLAAARAQVAHLVYTRQGLADWHIDQATTGWDGTSFHIYDRVTSMDVSTQLLGLHQIGPLAACVDIAFKQGLSSEKIKKGSAEIEPFDHRLQPTRLPGVDNVMIIDDTYNGNPDGARVAIEFLRDSQAGRKVYVTPGLVEMGDRAQAVHIQIGHQLAGVADKVILIKNSVTPHIAAGLAQKGFPDSNIIWFDDASRCYAALPSLTVAHDLVLLQNDWTDNYS